MTSPAERFRTVGFADTYEHALRTANRLTELGYRVTVEEVLAWNQYHPLDIIRTTARFVVVEHYAP